MRSLFLFLFLLSATAAGFAQTVTNYVIDAGLHHLGGREVKGFPEPNRKPETNRLDVAFAAEANQIEWTLQLKQRDVVDDWPVAINGQPVGRLNIRDAEAMTSFAVPRGLIVDGTNTLTIVGHPSDDILVGHINLIPKNLRDVLKLGHVTLNVLTLGRREPMPARISIANAANRHAEIYNVSSKASAWRKGIIYSAGGPVDFDLPEGDWIITATRGMEWSRPQQKLRVFIGQKSVINLPMSHEVDTTGYIAADTHLHTYTLSRHGDASVDERILTLAGEGVEMAIATDHNHFTDYKPKQAELGVSQYYTSVIGNEVTSANGHFNAFPFTLEAEKPNHKETNWVKLVEDMRSKGAQFVILNHPRWPAITNSPLSKWGLNRADGSRTNHMDFTFDAMEVLNSCFPLKDADFVLRDWFAVVSRGERIWAVGASDTHTVGDPPGQGRTYIPSGTDVPNAIDVPAVIKEMQAGNMSVAYGIFGEARVNGSVKMGETFKPTGTNINVQFRVACADWIPAREAVVYLNGRKVAQKELVMRPGGLLNTNLSFTIPTPAHDAFLVCVAFGDGVKDASWKTLSEYTLAVANPIFIDADGDGKYSSPRETALALLKKTGFDLAKIETTLAEVDPAIGVQIMSEAKLRIPIAQMPAWTTLLDKLTLKDDLYLAYKSPNVNP